MPPSPCLVLADERLPLRLRDLARVPERVYLRGELPRGPMVALVGTRHPSKPAAEFAHQLSRELSAAGVTVASGGAEGIDTEAHRGALEAGVPTVVVAPAGFERPFPEKNAELFERIVASGGAYLSLVPDEVPATRGAFFRRNGCLVALAHVLVVVEAGYRSGARNAAAQARHLGRSVLVVPAAPWNARGQGCLAELRGGARLCERAGDVLVELERESLHAIPRLPPETPRQAAFCFDSAAPEPGEEPERAVLAALDRGARHLDDVCRLTGLRAERAQALLLTLELRGVLVAGPDGLTRRTKSRT